MTRTEKPESSAEIEREAEISRARLALTLDQLRDNLNPHHLADELMGNARHGASAVLKTLGETAADHPVPALLLGAACAIFISSGKGLVQSPSPDRTESLTVPKDRAATSHAGKKPAHRLEPNRPTADDPDKESRWAGLGKRPLVTSLLGVIIGSSLAAILPHARSDDASMTR